MIEIKERLVNRFYLSQLYQKKRGQKEISRYTDKYRTQTPTEPFEPGKRQELLIFSILSILDFSRLPAELNWKGQAAGKKAKIRRLNEKTIEECIAKAEKNADEIDQAQASPFCIALIQFAFQEADETKKNDEIASSDDDQRPNINDDDNEISDEDYLEEGNDYVNTYFDNGEGAGDSDDNLDEDGVQS